MNLLYCGYTEKNSAWASELLRQSSGAWRTLKGPGSRPHSRAPYTYSPTCTPGTGNSQELLGQVVRTEEKDRKKLWTRLGDRGILTTVGDRGFCIRKGLESCEGLCYHSWIIPSHLVEDPRPTLQRWKTPSPKILVCSTRSLGSQPR